LNIRLNVSSSLTSNQRWDAIRLDNPDMLGQDGFILICGVILAILIMLFVIVSLMNAIKRKRNSNLLFIEYADKRGLNLRERQILMEIAKHARLRLAESIFSMGDVFDRGATKMARVALAKDGTKRSRYLSAELSMLREKMGFPKRKSVSEISLKKGKTTSRNIPEGRKIYLTNPESLDFFEVETFITENNDLSLCVQVTEMIECDLGDTFCARYYFGSMIWEFNTSILSIKDNILVLQHSDNIRYVNRRRFQRVGVSEPAYIAAFPFAKEISFEEKSRKKTDFESQFHNSVWEPPKFISADLIELAGPGLRLISPLEVNIGDRVIVILKLSKFNNRNNEKYGFENIGTRPYKIIEDIGLVKHAEKVDRGFSIAIELTGLTESNVSEMVRATNEASLSKKQIKEIRTNHKEKSTNWEYVSETIIG